MKKRIENFKVGEYALLIPESQKSHYSQLVSAWADYTYNVENHQRTRKPIHALYSNTKPIFAYITNPNGANLNLSYSVKEPIIFVCGAATFASDSADNPLAETGGNIWSEMDYYLTSGYVLTNDIEGVRALFEKYQLQRGMGSFYNGYTLVNIRLDNALNQRNLLISVNILSLLSSVLLITLLNSIYLYQNRREFLLQRLAGKSWFDIHSSYLSVLIVLTALVSLLAKYKLHAPVEAYVISVIYLVLIFLLFGIQVHRERQANILYLKGL
jgi:putative ABC transport system permease protein